MGVVRSERLTDADFYIQEMYKRVSKETFSKVYGVKDFNDCDELIDKIARKFGRVMKGNQPDIQETSKMILNDWQRGLIPRWTLPPGETDNEDKKPEEENKETEKTENPEKVTPEQ